MKSVWRAACLVEETDQRRIVPVRIDGRDLIVVRDLDRHFACERACPHEQADLSLGRCSSGKLFCPRHAASFDLRAGGDVSSGWRFRSLRMFPIRTLGALIQVNVA